MDYARVRLDGGVERDLAKIAERMDGVRDGLELLRADVRRMAEALERAAAAAEKRAESAAGR